MRVFKRTKIVTTIGPSSNSKEILLAMVNAGANVCRINFSHGSYEDHLETIKLVREINKEHKKHTAILADLQGPKIRIGEVENNAVELKDGAAIDITTNKVIGTKDQLYINYKDFAKDVSKGERILA